MFELKDDVKMNKRLMIFGFASVVLLAVAGLGFFVYNKVISENTQRENKRNYDYTEPSKTKEEIKEDARKDLERKDKELKEHNKKMYEDYEYRKQFIPDTKKRDDELNDKEYWDKKTDPKNYR